MYDLRVAAASTGSQPAEVIANTEAIIECIRDCRNRGVRLLVFPELSMTAATCGDLFFDELLLSKVTEHLKKIVKNSEDMLLVVGLPLLSKEEGKLLNAAAVINDKKLVGFVYHSELESPSFIPGTVIKERLWNREGELFGVPVLPCSSTVLSCKLKGREDEIRVSIDFADEKTILKPGSLSHNAGIHCVMGAIPARAGLKESIRSNLKAASFLCEAVFIFANASSMESTTDYVFEGELVIAEKGELLSDNLNDFEQVTVSDLDSDSLRSASYLRKKSPYPDMEYDEVLEVEIVPGKTSDGTLRSLSSMPYLPEASLKKRGYLEDILRLQFKALSKRMRATGIKKAVLGMSGGLDSTVALLSTVHTFQQMGLDTANIHAFLLPCFGSGERTMRNALALCEKLNISYKIIDIREAVTRHLEDIGHDIGKMDTTFENAQARERTQVLLDLANDLSALVIGTSDLSEIALGFSTYGGDHIAMYGMNNSLPKTVLKELIGYLAEEYEAKGEAELAVLLTDVRNTPISPELLPPKDHEISQITEDIIGPYELHDFFLYYLLKHRYGPRKIFELSCFVFSDKYEKKELINYMKMFYRRFFASAFKRSCSYDAPSLLGLSLSPRTEFRMPSDATAALWLDELERMEKEL